MQLLPNPGQKWPSIIKRWLSRGSLSRSYSRVVICTCGASGTELLRHRAWKKICENMSFNKTNHGGWMPAAAEFIILVEYVSGRSPGHSGAILTVNKSQSPTAGCAPTPLLAVISSACCLSHSGEHVALKPCQHHNSIV